MENFAQKRIGNPEILNSPLKEAYALLGAHTPLELSQRYDARDQELMKAKAWDYNNPTLITNRIKEILEAADVTKLTDDEKEWRQNILWFWYHHAISCAVARYHDKEKVKEYAAKALEYQSEDHPNEPLSTKSRGYGSGSFLRRPRLSPERRETRAAPK